jgi:MFS family permease
VALWAENAAWTADRQRATLQAFFLGLNLVALPSLGPPHLAGGTVAAAATALLVGVTLGGRVADRVPEQVARRTTLGLAAAGGLAVLVTAALP